MKTIGFQGAFGANSHIACKKFYPDFEAKSFVSFYDIFENVENGKIDLGIIPLENSYAGRVAEIHHLLQASNLFITSEHFLEIEHHIAGLNSASLEDIKEIYSHPQALLQCANNLRKLGIKPVESVNTAIAAKFISDEKDKTKAAICSKLAAQENGLKLLKENVQDSSDNMTVFVTISKNQAEINPKTAPVLTALIFAIRNIPGALYKALGGFATNNVSMVKLESYIPGGKSSEAKFFITIEGHPSEKNVALALEELGFFSKTVKLLGVYYADNLRFK